VLVADRVLYGRLPARLTAPDLPSGSVFVDALERAQTVPDDLWRTPPHSPHPLPGDLTPANTLLTPCRAVVPVDVQDLIWRRHPGPRDQRRRIAGIRQTTLPAERARRSQVRRRYGWVGLLAVPIHRRNRMSEQPATDAGTTRPAGAGVDDQELASQVGEQTSSDLQAEDVFERESGGATTDTEAAKSDGDDLT
jgi:hypothetical protein